MDHQSCLATRHASEVKGIWPETDSQISIISCDTLHQEFQALVVVGVANDAKLPTAHVSALPGAKNYLFATVECEDAASEQLYQHCCQSRSLTMKMSYSEQRTMRSCQESELS